MPWLADLLLVPCVSAIGFYGLAMVAAREFFARATTVDPAFHPPVTILKPLRGLDCEAYENFASFCRQAYPRYQIVFGVEDARDPAIAVVRQLIRDFPTVEIRLVVSRRSAGTNPKVSNLVNMEPEATHPILLISDSDIRVGPEYLMRVVQPLRDPRVGAVTCLCRSMALGFAGVLEALRVSTAFSPGVLVASYLEGMRFTLGSSIVVRREALAAVGGLRGVADYLADDFMIGRLLTAAGYAVALSDYVVEHALMAGGLRDVLSRQVRWNRGIRVSRPGGYAGLLFTQGIAMSVLFWVATAGSLWSRVVLGTTWLTRLAMARVVGIHYLRDRTVKQYWWLVPVSDLLEFWLWCAGFIGREITWRGRRYRVTRQGTLLPRDGGALVGEEDHHDAELAATA